MSTDSPDDICGLCGRIRGLHHKSTYGSLQCFPSGEFDHNDRRAQLQFEARPRLWEMKRPYYWSAASWYKPEDHFRYDSAKQFLEEFGDSDPDMNYVVRWDWGYFQQNEEGVLETTNHIAEFCVTVVHQRKGYMTTRVFPVAEDDEPMLYQWLQKRWETVKANWHPIEDLPDLS